MIKAKARWISLLSVTVLAIAGLGVALGATYALYTKQAEVTTHVTIGDLTFGFKRTKLQQHAIDENGYLADLPDDEKTLDLTKDGTKAFEADNGAPGAWYQATFELENTGGTAFNAKAEIPVESITLTGVDPEKRQEVLSQITVKFDTEDAKALDGNSFTYDLGTLEKKAKKTFTLNVSFLPTLGNEAQNAALEFPLRLTASQTT